MADKDTQTTLEIAVDLLKTTISRNNNGSTWDEVQARSSIAIAAALVEIATQLNNLVIQNEAKLQLERDRELYSKKAPGIQW